MALSVLVAFTLLVSTHAQSLPLVQSSDLKYLGAARLPDDPGALPNFDYGGGPMVFDDSDGGLYIGASGGTNGGRPVAKLKLPTEWGTGPAQTLPKATFLQPFVADVSNGAAKDLTGNGEGGLLSGIGITPDGRLLLNFAINYDAANITRKATMVRSRTLADATGGTPMSAIYDRGMQGHTAGECVVQIPAEYQARLGGTMITGSFGRSIISRGSAGPAAFAFDHRQIDGRGVVPAKALIDYPADRQTLGAWDRDPTEFYGSTDMAGGCVIVPGTRSLLYFGRHGYGKFCYGNGTSDKSLEGKRDGEGGIWCYDPTTSIKGQHGYPYRFFVWAYDLDQMSRVGARVRPWDLKPYAVWPFDLPQPSPNTFPQIEGVAYDRARRQILLAARAGNPVTFASVIHALQLPNFGETPQ